MTRSTVNPLGRLLVALSLTAATMFGSVAFATAASADDDSTESAYSYEQDADEDDAAEEAEKAAKKAAEEAEKAEEVTYEDDKVGQISAKLHAKNAKLGGLFDKVVSFVRVKVADYLIGQGRLVAFDQRGRLIVAPAVCDPAKPGWMQRNCVQPTEGAGRF
jgi:hypothetical protein